MHQFVEQDPDLVLPNARSGYSVVDWFPIEMGRVTIYGWTGIAGWVRGEPEKEGTEDDPRCGIEIGCNHPSKATIVCILNLSVGRGERYESRRCADESGITVGERRLGGISSISDRDVGDEIGDESGLRLILEEKLVGCATMGFTAFCVVDDGKQCVLEGLEEGTY